MSGSAKADSLALERQYFVEGYEEMIPYSVAKKFTRYPQWCVASWHEEDNVQQLAVRDSNLCAACTDSLRSTWAEMAAAFGPLQDMLHPSQQFGSSDRIGGGSIHPPLPFDGAISDLLRDIRDHVGSVVLQLVQDNPMWKQPASPTTDVLADNLAKWHADYVASHPRPGHARAVLEEAWPIGTRISRAGWSDMVQVEVPMNKRCWRRETTSAKVQGKVKLTTVRCEGMIVAVQSPTGARSVVCDVHQSHAVPVDIWLQIQQAQLPRPARTTNTLMKRYANGL
ncbi:hypothetical protein MB46_10345 [Arthrobacter alpinus]|nr:hypothetical protein MB46_10345 [Arthrobacter alpinus]